MLKGFRKTKKDDRRGEEEVTLEAFEEIERVTSMEEVTSNAQPPEPEPALSLEERRLKEAREHLEAVKAQNVDAMTIQEAEEAQRKLEEAQAKLDQVRDEQDKRFHEANRLVLEAEADIALAEQQKQTWLEVTALLEQFKQTDLGKNLPDDTALVFALLFEVAKQNANSMYATAGSLAAQTLNVFERAAVYHAYCRRIGLDR